MKKEVGAGTGKQKMATAIAARSGYPFEYKKKAGEKANHSRTHRSYRFRRKEWQP